MNNYARKNKELEEERNKREKEILAIEQLARDAGFSNKEDFLNAVEKIKIRKKRQKPKVLTPKLIVG